jgi:hypothetical protein
MSSQTLEKWESSSSKKYREISTHEHTTKSNSDRKKCCIFYDNIWFSKVALFWTLSVIFLMFSRGNDNNWYNSVNYSININFGDKSSHVISSNRFVIINILSFIEKNKKSSISSMIHIKRQSILCYSDIVKSNFLQLFLPRSGLHVIEQNKFYNDVSKKSFFRHNGHEDRIWYKWNLRKKLLINLTISYEIYYRERHPNKDLLSFPLSIHVNHKSCKLLLIFRFSSTTNRFFCTFHLFEHTIDWF